jgi:hypothetical protein
MVFATYEAIFAGTFAWCWEGDGQDLRCSSHLRTRVGNRMRKLLLTSAVVLASAPAFAVDIRCDGNIKIALDRVLIFDANAPRVCSIPLDQAGECGEQGAGTFCTVVGRVLYSRREKMYGGKVTVYYLSAHRVYPPFGTE